ncbi:hypothetical protein ARMGADRAFT_286984 [Armillaria gallica]|uniref:Uncharacterized protein n=1 Tax=Armillaria gallica TaxID=47427 RepID=A0A2H3DBD4_ARMGA|nr:hypothetical protein ARMGADRAFT_286984 [Armillaria gallica]
MACYLRIAALLQTECRPCAIIVYLSACLNTCCASTHPQDSHRRLPFTPCVIPECYRRHHHHRRWSWSYPDLRPLRDQFLPLRFSRLLRGEPPIGQESRHYAEKAKWHLPYQPGPCDIISLSGTNAWPSPVFNEGSRFDNEEEK